MPIKLADVIENANSDYPVLDSSIAATTGGAIKGFGIFRTTSARNLVPESKRCYGYVAVVLYADGLNGEVSPGHSVINLNNSPSSSQLEYDVNLDGTYTAADTSLISGREGVVITPLSWFGFNTSARVYIYKTYPFGLNVDSDGEDSVLSSAGGATPNVSVGDEDVTGVISANDWTNADNWTEVALSGHSYPRVPIDDLITDANNYRLAVSNASDNKLEGLGVNDLMGWILQSMIEAVAAAGLGTVTTYTNPDTGLVGDFNGDGLVGSADLLIFLQNFGNTIQSDAAIFDDSSYVISGSSFMDSQGISYLIQAALGGTPWSTPPTASELQDGGTDYQTGFFFSGAQGEALVGAWDVFESIGSTPANRSFFGFEHSTDAGAPTFQDGAVKIKLTACTVVAFGRFVSGVVSIGLVFRIRFKNSSGFLLHTKYHHWVADFSNTILTSGSSVDAFSVMPGGGPFILADFADQSALGVTDAGVSSNIATQTARIEVEFDYYVPDATSGVFYSISLASTVTCSSE